MLVSWKVRTVHDESLIDCLFIARSAFTRARVCVCDVNARNTRFSILSFS